MSNREDKGQQEQDGVALDNCALFGEIGDDAFTHHLDTSPTFDDCLREGNDVLTVYWLDTPYGSVNKTARFSQFLELLDSIQEGAELGTFQSRLSYDTQGDIARGHLSISWDLDERDRARRVPRKSATLNPSLVWVVEQMVPTLMNAYMLCRMMLVRESIDGSVYRMYIEWLLPDGVSMSSVVGDLVEVSPSPIEEPDGQ